MTLSSMLQAVSVAQAAASYCGFLEDKLVARLDKLTESELHSGIRALRQAISSEAEQQELLREARRSFNKAVALERGFRLAVAHLGLAICHESLGDRANSRAALRDVLSVKVPDLEWTHKAKIVAVAVGAAAFPLVGGLVYDRMIRRATPEASDAQDLRDLQMSVREYIQER